MFAKKKVDDSPDNLGESTVSVGDLAIGTVALVYRVHTITCGNTDYNSGSAWWSKRRAVLLLATDGNKQGLSS